MLTDAALLLNPLKRCDSIAQVIGVDCWWTFTDGCERITRGLKNRKVRRAGLATDRRCQPRAAKYSENGSRSV
jgi:hypothetical protein